MTVRTGLQFKADVESRGVHDIGRRLLAGSDLRYSIALQLVFSLSLHDLVRLLIRGVSVYSVDALHPGSCNLDATLSIFDVLAKQTELGLDQSRKGGVCLFCATCGNDAQVVFVVLREESVLGKKVFPRLLAINNAIFLAVDELIGAFKLLSHDVQRRVHDRMR